MRAALRWLPLLLIPVALGLGLFAFDFPRPGSDDMAPTLRKGDLVLACRLCGTPDRGDVVVFADPEQKGRLSIRRIVAAPGDRVEVRRGQVLVNGNPLVSRPEGTRVMAGLDGVPGELSFGVESQTIGAHEFRAVRDANLEPTQASRAPEMLVDSYFVLADRRTVARDSRDFGPVSTKMMRSIVKRVLQAGDGDGTRQTSIP